LCTSASKPRSIRRRGTGTTGLVGGGGGNAGLRLSSGYAELLSYAAERLHLTQRAGIAYKA
jgi:hypothetical protein